MPSSSPSGQPTCHPTSTPLAASFFGSGVHVAGVLFGVLLFAALSFLVYIYRAKILTYIGGGNHSVVSQSESDGRFNIDDEDNQGTYISRNVVLLLLFILFSCLFLSFLVLPLILLLYRLGCDRNGRSEIIQYAEPYGGDDRWTID